MNATVIHIFKLGRTWPETAQRLGDFEHWLARQLESAGCKTTVSDIEHGDALPPPEQCAGVVLTGSHSMVTDKLPWSVALEQWLRRALEAQTALLGVCYGHQLLAQAAGGRVDYHPEGREIGTVEISPLSAADNDPLFSTVPDPFLAHSTHAQSVIELPPDAVHLAGNDYEPHHAFRLGTRAWGVQFHPEYDTAIMQAYIDGQAQKLRAAGRDVDAVSASVRETPEATEILRRFGRFVLRSRARPPS